MDLKPFNSEQWLDAQYSVLGSMLISPEVVPKVMEGTVERDYCGTCRTVYRVMRKLFIDGIDIDPVSVNNALGKDYSAFLIQLMEVTPTAANIDHYIALCREQAQINGLRDLAAQMTQANTPEQMRKLFNQANELMVSKPRLKITTMSQALAEFMETQQSPASYINWPIPELNKFLYAEPGDFIVIGGFPSAGKTAFALQCMWHFARREKVGFFSLETQSKKLFARQISAIAGVSMRDIKEHTIGQAGWDRICAMTNRIVKTDIEFLDAAGCTLEDIRAATLMRGYKIIFVDYLQLIQSGGYSRTEQVTAISMGLHTMAQTLGVTVVALSQLSRNPSDARNQLPDMSRLRESGQIEQDADVVLMLSLKDGNDRDGQRILQIAKNKEGTRPDMVLNFDGERQTFTKASALDQAVNDVEQITSKIKPKGAKGKKSDKSSKEWVPGQMDLLPPDPDLPPNW